MIKTVKRNYQTYYNSRTQQSENHFRRILFFVLAAVFAAIFSDRTSNQIFSMMITGITILTGFAFTALFSDHAQADVGLTKPKNENDISDIGRLGLLSENFQARALYFISISIVEVCILIVLSLNLTIPSVIRENLIRYSDTFSIDSQLFFDSTHWFTYILTAATAGAFFLFLECLYTFYRLSETTTAILNARREYLRIKK